MENRKKWLHMKTKNQILHLVQEEITEMDFKQILEGIQTNENYVEGFMYFSFFLFFFFQSKNNLFIFEKFYVLLFYF